MKNESDAEKRLIKYVEQCKDQGDFAKLEETSNMSVSIAALVLVAMAIVLAICFLPSDREYKPLDKKPNVELRGF